MFQEIGRRIKSMNTKSALSIALIIAMLFFIIMPIIAYKSHRDPVVGTVVASSIFGITLNLVTMIANSNDNYFLVYVYFALTVLHIVLNIAISISFPLLNILVLLQIFLAVVAFFHARTLRFGTVRNAPYMYGPPDTIKVDAN